LVAANVLAGDGWAGYVIETQPKPGGAGTLHIADSRDRFAEQSRCLCSRTRQIGPVPLHTSLCSQALTTRRAQYDRCGDAASGFVRTDAAFCAEWTIFTRR
jgi:hypothetical protein